MESQTPQNGFASQQKTSKSEHAGITEQNPHHLKGILEDKLREAEGREIFLEKELEDTSRRLSRIENELECEKKSNDHANELISSYEKMMRESNESRRKLTKERADAYDKYFSSCKDLMEFQQLYRDHIENYEKRFSIAKSRYRTRLEHVIEERNKILELNFHNLYHRNVGDVQFYEDALTDAESLVMEETQRRERAESENAILRARIAEFEVAAK